MHASAYGWWMRYWQYIRIGGSECNCVRTRELFITGRNGILLPRVAGCDLTVTTLRSFILLLVHAVFTQLGYSALSSIYYQTYILRAGQCVCLRLSLESVCVCSGVTTSEAP